MSSTLDPVKMLMFDKRVFSYNKNIGDSFFLMENIFAEFLFFLMLWLKEKSKEIYTNTTSSKTDFYWLEKSWKKTIYEFEITGSAEISNFACVDNWRKIIKNILQEIKKDPVKKEMLWKYVKSPEKIVEIIPYFASPSRKFIRFWEITNSFEKIDFQPIVQEWLAIYDFFFKWWKSTKSFKNYFVYKNLLNQNNRMLWNGIYTKFYEKTNNPEVWIKNDYIVKMFLNKNISAWLYRDIDKLDDKMKNFLIEWFNLYKGKRNIGDKTYKTFVSDLIGILKIKESEYVKNVWIIRDLLKNVKYEQEMFSGETKKFKGVEMYKIDRNDLFDVKKAETILLEQIDTAYTTWKYKNNTFVSLPKDYITEYKY